MAGTTGDEGTGGERSSRGRVGDSKHLGEAMDLKKVEEALRERAALDRRAAEIEARLSPRERDLLFRLSPLDSAEDIARIARGLK